MKRLLLFLLLPFLAILNTQAMPAYPGKMIVKQADGTQLTIFMRGDEHYSMAFTEDGYPLLFNNATRNYEYAVTRQKALVTSGIIAQNSARRSAVDKVFLQKNVDKGEAMSIANSTFVTKQRRAAGKRKIRISDIPCMGKQKTLVLLVQFPDKKFSTVGSDPKQYYTDLLNKPNYTNEHGATGSAYDYYRKSSNGLYDPEFVVVGPVTMPQSYVYYGQDMGTYHDVNLGEFVFHATQLASLRKLVDYSQFDSDGDGKVDNVYIFYAGNGQADTGISNCLWPCSGYLHDDFEATMVLDGDTINRFAISQEINGQTGEPVGISTFVHEYAHVLGLADHYNSINQGAGGVGDWDVMGTGPYNNNQNTPPLMSSFEQAELGWLNYTTLSAKTDTIVTIPSLDTKPIGLRVNVEGKPNEYFVVENRQQTGWDTYLPGHGVIVWHVDMDSTAWLTNRVNADPQHQHLKLVEADGTPDSDGGDAFPGSKDVTKYTFNDEAGKPAFGFDYVEETGDATGDVSFVLSGSGYRPASPAPVTASKVLGHQVTLSWNAVKDASGYKVAILQGKDTMTTVKVDNGTSVTIHGLEPSTDYTASVRAAYGPFDSNPAATAFSTTMEQYEEKHVVATSASNVSKTSFTANWMPLPDSYSYKVTLYKDLLTGTGADFWDFTDKTEGKPEGWTTNCNRYDSNNFGTAAPALRLSRDGEYLIAAHPGGKATKIGFWYRASTTGNALTVEAFKDGEWHLVTDSIKPQKDDSVRFRVAVDNADSVRIGYHRSRSGYVTIDDVKLDYAFEQYFKVDSAIVNGASDHEFKGLDEGVEYSYIVSGNNGKVYSLPSNRITVQLLGTTGIETPTSDRAKSKGNGPLYNVNGQRVGSDYRGIVVRQGRKFIKR